jgi:hypothetical protein
MLGICFCALTAQQLHVAANQKVVHETLPDNSAVQDRKWS